MSEYGDKIISLLKPKLGEEMAKSTLKVLCRKSGLSHESIESDDIESLAESLYGPLKIFAGDKFAEEMVAKIKSI